MVTLTRPSALRLALVAATSCAAGPRATSEPTAAAGASAARVSADAAALVPVAKTVEPASATRAEPPFSFASGSVEQFFRPYVESMWGAQAKFPRWQSSGDVVGGSQQERIVLLHRYVIVAGPEIDGFYYRDFGEAGNVSDVALASLTRSAKRDLIVRFWQRAGGYRHDVLEVWAFTSQTPRVIFTHGVGVWAECCGSEANAPPHVRGEVLVRDNTITLRAGRAWRISAQSFDAPGLPGIPPPLLPWAAVTARTFTFDGLAWKASSD